MSGPDCDNLELLGFGSSNASSLAAYVILYYDYFITLPSEIDRFWRTGSHSWASILFLANRYAALLGHLPLFYDILTPACKAARIASHISSYHQILIFLLTVLTGVLLIMRVYALYCRNKWVLSVVLLEAVAAIFVACWSLIRIVPGNSAAVAALSRPHLRAQAIAFSGLLVFDFTVFVLTIARSLRLWTRREPLLHRIIFDGLLYYSVIWNFNLLNIIILLVITPHIDLSTPIFTVILSVVMVSRIMINLHDPTLHRPTDCDETVTTSNGGCVSTVVLGEITCTTTVGTQSESNQ